MEPVFYTEVTDQEGNVLLSNKPQGQRVFKESTAFLLTSAMEEVVSEGTGTGFQLEDMHVAGKTGTANDYRDLSVLKRLADKHGIAILLIHHLRKEKAENV